MTSNELIEEIRIELENIEVVLQELACLYEDVKEREVSPAGQDRSRSFSGAVL